MRVCDLDCDLVLVGVPSGDGVPEPLMELLMNCDAPAGVDVVIEKDDRNVCDTYIEDVWERVGLPVIMALCDDDAVPLANPFVDAIELMMAS